MQENFKQKKPEFQAGPNAVEALLEKRPDQVIRLVIQKDSGSRRIHLLANLAKQLKINVQQLGSQQLDRYSKNHQGVLAFCHARPLDPWEETLAGLKKVDSALIVVSSGLEDPHNLGACIRSAHALGVHTMLLPRKGGCGLTDTCAKAAAGSLEKIKISKPDVLEEAIRQLGQEGFHICGLEAQVEAPEDAKFAPRYQGAFEKLNKVSFAAKQVIIIGGEDKGIPPYLAKQCDAFGEIPMIEGAHSYNASVALALGLYEYRSKYPF